MPQAETSHLENHKIKKHIRYAIIFLVVVLIALVVGLLFEYRSLRRQETVDAWHIHNAMFLEHHAPLPVTENTVIRPWMTFDYINKLFALPPEYLKEQVGVTSSQYPRLTLSNYAKTEDASTTQLLMQVEGAVGEYTTSTPPGQASSSIL